MGRGPGPATPSAERDERVVRTLMEDTLLALLKDAPTPYIVGDCWQYDAWYTRAQEALRDAG